VTREARTSEAAAPPPVIPYNPGMPIYEFKCVTCGQHFELLSSLADRDEQAVCPSCGGRDVSQVLGGFTVGISRTKLNPGVFERKKGQAPAYKPPAGG
jgi:putative FmdB family regulatory protein